MRIYPRVLHTGFHPIGAPTNSGLTLASMFGAWPEDRLMQVCLREHPTWEHIGDVHIAPRSIAPAEAAARAALGRYRPTGAVDGLNASISRKGRQLGAGARLRIAAATINEVSPVRLPSSTIEIVSHFRPDVIHSLLGGLRAMKVALAFSKKFDLPIVPHFMDDWPATIYSDNQLRGLARRQAVGLLSDVLERSPVLLTIGEDMAEEYETRYGVPAVVVGNSSRAFATNHPKTKARDPLPELVYAGGLHLDRDRVISVVARAIDQWNSEGRSLRVRLYVPPGDHQRARRLESEYRCVDLGGSLAPNEVLPTLATSFAGLFIESSDPSIARFTRLSVSTKVPQYLASQRPSLVIGPSDQGSVRALTKSGHAVYGGSGDSSTDLAAALDSLWTMASGTTHFELPDIFTVESTQRRLQAALVRASDSRND